MQFKTTNADSPIKWTTFSYYTNFPLGFSILHVKHPSLT